MKNRPRPAWREGRKETGKQGCMEAGKQGRTSRRPAFARPFFRVVDARSLPRFEAGTVARAKVVYRRTGLVQELVPLYSNDFLSLIRFCGEKHADAIRMVGFASFHERRFAFMVALLETDTGSFDQELQHIDIVVFGRTDERRVAVVVLRIDVCARFD